jgi:FkbM family methyltransferase
MSLFEKIIAAPYYYMKYADIFGTFRGPLLLTASHIRPKLAGRRVMSRLPGTEIPLILRLRTSDLIAFLEIFLNREYDWSFNAPPTVIVDIGAYIGLSTAFFASKYPQATIIAVEPDPENFELLKFNTARFPNVHAMHAAVWRENGVISITDPGIGAWGLRVTDADADPGAGLVRAVTLDQIIKEFSLDRIDLLKVDVEGSETEIFATANSWISAVDVICAELHDWFKPGCSRSFYQAVGEFPIELRRNEDVLVARAESRLNPIGGGRDSELDGHPRPRRAD